MKTLAQYLAEYLETEFDRANQLHRTQQVESLHEWIKLGMDAYMSTENCTISIIPVPLEKQCMGCEFQDGKYCSWSKKKRTGQPPCQQK